jgi:hypothetical protein
MLLNGPLPHLDVMSQFRLGNPVTKVYLWDASSALTSESVGLMLTEEGVFEYFNTQLGQLTSLRFTKPPK